MVPAIRNILGGFLFSGDDVYKKAGVLSGGERTRLAVARMLLIPSNTLLLDEPTNHLDLDSKDILLEALEDYGGTLIFVSHDRYFVERLANKIVEIGHGEARVFPGTYPEFLWSKEQRPKPDARQLAPTAPPAKKQPPTPTRNPRQPAGPPHDAAAAHEARKRAQAEQRKRDADAKKRATAIAELEARIAEREQAMKDLEATMAAPGFYDDRNQAQPIIERHQALMWELGDLMHQWEDLQR
jgi:ATP-binding cassette subfamily F protein 3